jgi:prolyl-tRNA synthetase
MRMSQLFGKTLRQDPAEAETPSLRLLLRAGMATSFPGRIGGGVSQEVGW